MEPVTTPPAPVTTHPPPPCSASADVNGKGGHITNTDGTKKPVVHHASPDEGKALLASQPVTQQPTLLQSRSSQDFTQEMQARVDSAITESNTCCPKSCPNWWQAMCNWWNEPNPVEPEPIATQSESTFGVSDCCSDVLSSCLTSVCNTATTACSSCCGLMQRTPAYDQLQSAYQNTYKPCCESSASCCTSACSSCTKNCLDTVTACWRCWTGSKTAQTIESEFSARYFMATDDTDGTTQTLTSQQRQQLLTGIEIDLDRQRWTPLFGQ